MKKEIDEFTRALAMPKKPFLAIMGGAKVADKIQLIRCVRVRVRVRVAGGGGRVGGGEELLIVTLLLVFSLLP
jgi:3-phosphoglycerate kinase